MPVKDVDYTLYLVTDSTPKILGDKDLVSTVKSAIAGGRSRASMRCKASIRRRAHVWQASQPYNIVIKPRRPRSSCRQPKNSTRSRKRLAYRS